VGASAAAVCPAAAEPEAGVTRKAGLWALALFVIFYIATEPTGAAAMARHAYNGVHDAAASLAQFVNAL
jgi:hypothetical protein